MATKEWSGYLLLIYALNIGQQCEFFYLFLCPATWKSFVMLTTTHAKVFDVEGEELGEGGRKRGINKLSRPRRAGLGLVHVGGSALECTFAEFAPWISRTTPFPATTTRTRTARA